MADTGFEDLEAAMKSLVDHADEASKAAAQAASVVLQRGIQLELSRSSHSAGTKTPANPGQPPSLITGRLRQSVRVTRLARTGSGQWTATVGATTVYARIQELGGDTGKGHRTHLPPRPYVRPAEDKWTLKARESAIAAFTKACGLR